ncbi:MAG: glycosyltransferase family 2 protein [Armatimonadota bacterium]|nr:glycosyltransferase family 2 protein [Armatimonadota bacterium]MDR7422803.1 glycosyltransferase family 2 protein [Armatimonadota bacterium]MDR7453337.1 glycosyltransferase family 2 protein [Armatimonadota bacterium]MDR7457023.1 glycosyltransferase family 2 protein [Armatimonadota bacterium]MDR7497205.1 glycosyltransferase family 2 protein [Armatimonadota bacterium]
MRTLVLLPLYNEAATVGRVLDEVGRHARGADVLVVDDGSTDGSAAVLRDRPSVGVLTHPENEGYGQSLIDGFAYALAHGYEAVVTLDCDEQHEPRQIPQFLEALAGADIVSGSRYVDPAAAGDPAPPDRRRLNEEMTARVRAITGYPITDAFCGFKAYRAAALAAFRLDEPSYGLPLQVWVQAAAHRLRVVELATARIYKNPERRFWGGLDDAEVRRRYYLEVLDREVARWLASSR